MSEADLMGSIRICNQENLMLKRIIINLKRKLRIIKVMNRHKFYGRWPKKMRYKIIKLRDIDKKDFSDISKILNLSNRQCRSLYSVAKRG